MLSKTNRNSRKDALDQGRKSSDKVVVQKEKRSQSLGNPLDEVALDEFQNQTLVALGKCIRIARHERGMTMKTVFEAAGLERAYYGRLELGLVNVSIVNLRKIAQALNTSVQNLLKNSDL